MVQVFPLDYPARRLDHRERGAPASGFWKLVLGVLTEPPQLLYAHERQQSWFQTDAELQREPGHRRSDRPMIRGDGTAGARPHPSCADIDRSGVPRHATVRMCPL